MHADVIGQVGDAEKEVVDLSEVAAAEGSGKRQKNGETMLLAHSLSLQGAGGRLDLTGRVAENLFEEGKAEKRIRGRGGVGVLKADEMFLDQLMPRGVRSGPDRD